MNFNVPHLLFLYFYDIDSGPPPIIVDQLTLHFDVAKIFGCLIRSAVVEVT